MSPPNNLRRQLILNATLTIIKSIPEWTTWHIAELVKVPKSIVYHYFGSKPELTRAAWAHYMKSARDACDIAVDLSMWVAMRADAELARMVRAHREDERAFLKIEFDGALEAWLAQALHVGLGVMRESGVEVNEQEIKKLFKELVFENHIRNRSPEMKAGVEEALST